jgi:ubiquinone/menaquinone biosynthesis C-methylase UbiE
VTGLDANRELLDIARRRTEARLANLCWLEADLAALDLSKTSFDAIRTSCSGLARRCTPRSRSRSQAGESPAC